MQIDTTGPDHHQQWEDYCAMKDAERVEVTPEGLRMRASMCREPMSDGASTATHLHMAADEIERLRAENERLREALKYTARRAHAALARS